MIDEKLKHQDEFWDIPAQERRRVKEHDQHIERLERMFALAKKAEALQGQPGFLEFLESIDKLKEALVSQMIAHVGSDSDLRVKQGFLQGVESVGNLVAKSSQLAETLAKQLAEAKNARALLVTAGGKVVPEQPGVKP